MGHRCPYILKTGVAQSGLTDPEKVDVFKRLMLEGHWDFEGQGKTLVYWRRGQTIYVASGHHRVNAALEIGQKSGDWSFLERLLKFGTEDNGYLPQSNIGRFPTRTWWSWLMEKLGL